MCWLSIENVKTTEISDTSMKYENYQDWGNAVYFNILPAVLSILYFFAFSGEFLFFFLWYTIIFQVCPLVTMFNTCVCFIMCYFFVFLCHLPGKYSNYMVCSTIPSYAISQLYLFSRCYLSSQLYCQEETIW